MTGGSGGTGGGFEVAASSRNSSELVEDELPRRRRIGVGLGMAGAVGGICLRGSRLSFVTRGESGGGDPPSFLLRPEKISVLSKGGMLILASVEDLWQQLLVLEIQAKTPMVCVPTDARKLFRRSAGAAVQVQLTGLFYSNKTASLISFAKLWLRKSAPKTMVVERFQPLRRSEFITIHTP